MTSIWEDMVAAQRHFRTFSIISGFAGFAFGFGALSGIEALRWGAVVFGLLSAHAFTAWIAMGRIANLQAALDMRQAALGVPPPGTVQMLAGEIHELTGVSAAKLTLRVRAHTRCLIEVLPPQ